MRTRKTPKQPMNGFRHLPFRQLAQMSVEPRKPERRPPPESARQLSPPSEEDLFRREMANVRPLAEEPARVAKDPPARSSREIVDAEAEVLAELSDLVTGIGPFDITNTAEYLEGAVIGLDPRLVRRLRAGEFAYQRHLDLHGLTAEEARRAVDDFLANAYRRGQRCVLIIHGRGLNSEGHNPVLKKRLAGWLAHGAHARLVLAFTSARACDGGAGALYVLLRRQRQPKKPMRVTEGSKA